MSRSSQQTPSSLNSPLSTKMWDGGMKLLTKLPSTLLSRVGKIHPSSLSSINSMNWQLTNITKIMKPTIKKEGQK